MSASIDVPASFWPRHHFLQIYRRMKFRDKSCKPTTYGFEEGSSLTCFLTKRTFLSSLKQIDSNKVHVPSRSLEGTDRIFVPRFVLIFTQKPIHTKRTFNALENVHFFKYFRHTLIVDFNAPLLTKNRFKFSANYCFKYFQTAW